MAPGQRAHPDPCDALCLLRLRGERAYNGKIFESRRHSERLLASGRLLDVDIPWTVDEIEAAKYEVMKANGLTDAYVRAVAWRGSGEDMGVSSAKNPVRLAVAAWEWGAITATRR
jgi:branched-chain amino acid aminotransferase